MIKFFRSILGATLLLSLLQAAQAQESFGTINIAGTSSVEATGTATPTYTVLNSYSPNDFINFSASGSVQFFQYPVAPAAPIVQGIVNAAGIYTSPSTPGLGLGTAAPASLQSGGTFTTGSILVSTSSSFATATQIFPANAADGLNGSGTSAPTDLLFSGTVGSLFFGNGLTANEILYFEVADVNPGDNIGSFSLSGNITPAPEIDAASAVTPIALSLFLGLLVTDRRRRANLQAS